MKEIKTLKPFTRFLMTIGELPSSYLISMTYEEQLLWFCNYLQNTVIPALNNNAEAVIELQNYVANYFDNLDVQEEINNKLDEMAKSGELEEIIREAFVSNCKYHFLKLGDRLGDSVLLELENKNILSDIGGSATISYLSNYLDGKGITKIDGIIISHYHGDHVGGASAEGFVDLINSNYVDGNTIVYLPTDPDFERFIDDNTNVVERIMTIKNAILEACDTKNIEIKYMKTNDEISFDKTTLRFLNSDDISFEDYYNITTNSNNEETTHTNYNNFSMVTEVQNLNSTLLLTGDIEYGAEVNVAKFLNRPISIKKIEHHGLNHLSNANYLMKSKAYYNVCMQTLDINDNFGKYESLAFNIDNNNLNLMTESNNTIIFEDNGNEVKAITQINNQIFNYANGIAGRIAANDNTHKSLGEVSYRNLIKTNDDLDDYTTSGDYVCSNGTIATSLSNSPVTNAAFKLTVEYINNKDRILQKIVKNIGTIEIYYRYYDSNGWNNWYLINPKRYGEAKRSSNQALTGATDYTKITLNNLTYATDFELTDGGLSPLYSVTVLSGGFMIIDGVDVDDVINLALFKNSTRIGRFQIKANATSVSIPIPQMIIPLTSSDKLYLFVKNETSGKATITANSAFNVISL